jgi:hypothetical protein
MSAPAQSPATIQLRLRDLAQLFNSMDPSPFHERDLDADAEEFIIGWALEHPKDRELEVEIYLSELPSPEKSAGIEESLRHYFRLRSETKEREFRRLMRRGRVSLIVGLLFLLACFFLSELVARIGYGTAAELLRESLTIGGWVAMWRPLEIYLYDWWPSRSAIPYAGSPRIRVSQPPGWRPRPRPFFASPPPLPPTRRKTANASSSSLAIRPRPPPNVPMPSGARRYTLSATIAPRFSGSSA